MSWSDQLCFVGGVINVCGNDAKAMAERCTKGLKVFHAWKNLLQFQKVPLHRRLLLLTTAVVSCLAWLCETWTTDERSVQGHTQWLLMRVKAIIGVKMFKKELIGEYVSRASKLAREP